MLFKCDKTMPILRWVVPDVFLQARCLDWALAHHSEKIQEFLLSDIFILCPSNYFDVPRYLLAFRQLLIERATCQMLVENGFINALVQSYFAKLESNECFLDQGTPRPILLWEQGFLLSLHCSMHYETTILPAINHGAYTDMLEYSNLNDASLQEEQLELIKVYSTCSSKRNPSDTIPEDAIAISTESHLVFDLSELTKRGSTLQYLALLSRNSSDLPTTSSNGLCELLEDAVSSVVSPSCSNLKSDIIKAVAFSFHKQDIDCYFSKQYSKKYQLLAEQELRTNERWKSLRFLFNRCSVPFGLLISKLLLNTLDRSARVFQLATFIQLENGNPVTFALAFIKVHFLGRFRDVVKDSRDDRSCQVITELFGKERKVSLHEKDRMMIINEINNVL